MDIKQRATKVQRNAPKYIECRYRNCSVAYAMSSVAERSTPTRYVIDQTSSVSSMQDGTIQMGKPANTPSSVGSKTLGDDQAEYKMALDKETGLRVIATRVIEAKYKPGVLIDQPARQPLSLPMALTLNTLTSLAPKINFFAKPVSFSQTTKRYGCPIHTDRPI